jgi:tetratricopeptide (TPR) repeat protein
MSFDYSKPIMDQNNQMTEKGGQLMDEARKAFLEGNYEAASRIIAQAAQEMPKNHDVHQFRSLILFAIGDYSNAAGAAHVALTGGPGWNWTTLRSFYKEKATYAEQRSRLEETSKKNDKAAELRFLLGYHYLMINYVDAAAKQLAIAVELEPRDELSKKLLNAISKKTGNTYKPSQGPKQNYESTPGPKETYEPTPGPKQINVVPTIPEPPAILESEVPKTEIPKPLTTEKPISSYTGIFKASPEKDVNFKLELRTDGKFTWSIDNPKTQDEFSGTFQIENNTITLIRDKDGEKMIAILTPDGKGFNFKMQNSPMNDPGLNFQP